MANFVYNKYETGKFLDLAESQRQWYNYVQQKEFHDDLTATIKSGHDSYRKELQRNAELAGKDMSALREDFSHASEQQLQAIHDQTKAMAESAEMICGTLDYGFSELSGSLDDLAATLDWRLTAVEDQLRISNLLLENIGLLLRIPDFQKERQYYIEQGFKHYKNAAFDNDLFQNALENLLEAEKREISDYVVLHRIGMIYLYAPDQFNPVKAEDYFRRAAKFAVVESNPDAQQSLNLLAGDPSRNLSSQASTPYSAKAVAAKAYFQAGIACYIQGNFNDALSLSLKAYELIPSNLEAGFNAAKCHAVLGEVNKSVAIVAGLISKERFYSVKTVADADLAFRPEIQSMLRELRDETLNQAISRLRSITTKLLSDSSASPYIPEIEELTTRGSYLDSLRALDLLTEKRQWYRPQIIFEKGDDFQSRRVEWVLSDERLSLEEFVNVEAQYRQDAINLEKRLRAEFEVADQRKQDAEKQRIENIRKRIDEDADRTINNFYRELPRRLKVAGMWSFIGWLTVGTGACFVRSCLQTLENSNKYAGRDKPPGGVEVLDASSYRSEGVIVALVIGAICGVVILVKFLTALAKSASIRSTKP